METCRVRKHRTWQQARHWKGKWAWRTLAAPPNPPCAAGQAPKGRSRAFVSSWCSWATDYLVLVYVCLASDGDTIMCLVGGALAYHWPHALMLSHFVAWPCLSLGG